MLVQKSYVIVPEIIVEDTVKLYTAFLAVRNDQVEAYTGMTEYMRCLSIITRGFVIMVCRGSFRTGTTITLDEIY